MRLFVPVAALLALASGLVSSAQVAAEPVQGYFTGVVTGATDLGQLSFGRDPSDWVGRTVTGTFAYDTNTPLVTDIDLSLNLWTYNDPTGEAEWMSITAFIDDQQFTAAPPDGTSAIGDVLIIHDNDPVNAFRPQDSFLSASGRSLIGFDAFGTDGFVDFDGVASLSLDFADGNGSGNGLIEDLFVQGSATIREGRIDFALTDVAIISLPQTYEGEDAGLIGARVDDEIGGFTGTGYAVPNDGGSIEWPVYVSDAALYQLEIRYSQGAGNVAVEVYQDALLVEPQVTLQSTGQYGMWVTVAVYVHLEAGLNEIQLVGEDLGETDGDGDGIGDQCDNCVGDANGDQRDTNSDGFGNSCDADFNGNNIVDPFDFSLLKANFGSSLQPDIDLNGNGVIDPFDFSKLKSEFGQVPGPKGSTVSCGQPLIDNMRVSLVPLYVQPYLIIPVDTTSAYGAQEAILEQDINNAFSQMRAWYLARMPGKNLIVTSYIPVFSSYSKAFHECRDQAFTENGVPCFVNDPYSNALLAISDQLGLTINTWENEPCNIRSAIIFYKHHPGYAGALSAQNPEPCTVGGTQVISSGGAMAVGSAAIYQILNDPDSIAECLAEYERYDIQPNEFPAYLCDTYNAGVYTITHELGHLMGEFDYCGTGNPFITGNIAVGLFHPDPAFVEGPAVNDCLISSDYLPWVPAYWDSSVMGAAHTIFPFGSTNEGLNAWAIEALSRDPYFFVP